MSEHIIPHASCVSPEARMRITGSRPAVYWMTGLSGAGKSTIASLVEKELTARGHAALMLDGDAVRAGLCRGLGFSPEERHENLRRIAEVAKIAACAGMTVLVCTISPAKEDREQARAIIEPAARFCEVYVRASVEICAARDPKGLYRKAYAGEIEDFTGVSAPYEEPEDPGIVLDTADRTPEECADLLVSDALFEDYGGERLLRVMLEAAVEASGKIMEIYESGYSVACKSDRSPLTSADLASDGVLTAVFRREFPEYSILSEEEADSAERLSNRAGVFIIDPLDGTKEFLAHNGEFCVSVGFAQDRSVRAGVIAVPAQKILYYAMEGRGAYKLSFDGFGASAFRIGAGERLRVSERTDALTVTVSRSHLDRDTEVFLRENRERIARVVTVGSCLKGCLIAEGKADLHWRTGAFMKEWDTAGMQILCEEAGGLFTDSEGNPMPANREDPVNRKGLCAANRAETLAGLKFPEQ